MVASTLTVARYFTLTLGALGLTMILGTPALGASTYSRVSVGPSGRQANGPSDSAALSADGRVVVFRSPATNLDSRCANGLWHAYVHDRSTRTTQCVSVNAASQPADLGVSDVAVSGDGHVVALVTAAANLDSTDTNGWPDIFLYDRGSGSLSRVTDSQAPPTPTPQAGGASHPVLSGDGRYLAYLSRVSDEPIVSYDVRLYDHQTRSAIRVNRATDGSRGDGISGGYFNVRLSSDSLFRPGLSSDGRFIGFVSSSTNLVPSDTNRVVDVFVFDRDAGSTERVSVDSRGAEVPFSSEGSAMSADGRAVGFVGALDFPDAPVGVYVHDRGLTTLVSRTAMGAGARSGCLSVSRFSFCFAPALSADGRRVAYVSGADDIVPGCERVYLSGNLFVFDRTTATVTCLTRGANGATHPHVSLSASGRVVAMATEATNLVPGISDTNRVADVIVVDLDAPAETPIPEDFDGDGQADFSVYHPDIGRWSLSPTTAPFLPLRWGSAALGDIPVRGDFDGDGQADVTVFRQRTGEWFIRRSTVPTVPLVVRFGAPSLGDVPIPADYDGDERTDIAVFRRTTGEWFIQHSSGGLRRLGWGASALGDVPVPADYDGDGRADIAVFRTANGRWFILRSADSSLLELHWGTPSLGDTPVVADYDGDHRADIAVFRRVTNQWFVRRSSDETLLSTQWGAVGDVAVPADYDGDAIANIAVYRSSTGQWFVRP